MLRFHAVPLFLHTITKRLCYIFWPICNGFMLYSVPPLYRNPISLLHCCRGKRYLESNDRVDTKVILPSKRDRVNRANTDTSVTLFYMYTTDSRVYKTRGHHITCYMLHLTSSGNKSSLCSALAVERLSLFMTRARHSSSRKGLVKLYFIFTAYQKYRISTKCFSLPTFQIYPVFSN